MLKIDFENQILALFEGYFWPFNKSHEKIKSIFVISAIQSEMFLSNSVDMMKNLPRPVGTWRTAEAGDCHIFLRKYKIKTRRFRQIFVPFLERINFTFQYSRNIPLASHENEVARKLECFFRIIFNPNCIL